MDHNIFGDYPKASKRKRSPVRAQNKMSDSRLDCMNCNNELPNVSEERHSSGSGQYAEPRDWTEYNFDLNSNCWFIRIENGDELVDSVDKHIIKIAEEEKNKLNEALKNGNVHESTARRVTASLNYSLEQIRDSEVSELSNFMDRLNKKPEKSYDWSRRYAVDNECAEEIVSIAKKIEKSKHNEKVLRVPYERFQVLDNILEIMKSKEEESRSHLEELGALDFKDFVYPKGTLKVELYHFSLFK